jgi:hypothetical protein
MSGRHPTANLEVRNAVALALTEYFKSAEESKAGFARRWEINQHMLYRYLKATATPSTEVLAKLVRVPGLELPFAGRILKPQDVPLRPRKNKGTDLQLDLDFDQPLTVKMGDQDLTVAVVRRPNGRLEIRLDMTPAA